MIELQTHKDLIFVAQLQTLLMGLATGIVIGVLMVLFVQEKQQSVIHTVHTEQITELSSALQECTHQRMMEK